MIFLNGSNSLCFVSDITLNKHFWFHLYTALFNVNSKARPDLCTPTVFYDTLFNILTRDLNLVSKNDTARQIT